MAKEYELCSATDKPALVGLFKLDADIVCLRGLVDIVLEGDVFHKETVLEPEEGEQVDVEPFLDVVGPREHRVEPDFVLVEIPVVEFLVDGPKKQQSKRQPIKGNQ